MALQRLSALFLFAVASAALTPEECVADDTALLQTASKINSDVFAHHGAVLQGQKSEAVEKVDLGTAANYAILTKSGISTIHSSITGNIAVSPAAGTYMTGFSFTADSSAEFSRSSQIQGFAYAPTDSPPTPTILTSAVRDLETAYNDASQRANTNGYNLGGGNIGSMTLMPGVYTFFSDININANITFSGGAYDVFILQTTGALMQAASTNVILKGGAQAKNIFWQVTDKVSVGDFAVMQGILLAKTSVAFETSSSLTGRVLAQTACTLQEATITQPDDDEGDNTDEEQQ